MMFHGPHGGGGHGGHGHGHHHHGHGGGFVPFYAYTYAVECDPNDPTYLACLDRFGCDAVDIDQHLQLTGR